MASLPRVVAVLTSFPCLAVAADLTIVPDDQDEILLHVIADAQCPLVCPPPTPCCQNFDAIIEKLNQEVPDLTMLNGDLVICSYEQTYLDQFLQRWNAIQGEKHFALGNHEADHDAYFEWVDPNDHYVPAVTYEPLFRWGTPDYRRWYSIHVGDPPRVALFILNNNSDSWMDDDACYRFCGTPPDSLNQAVSSQRVWLNAEIDALPPTVQFVLICLHRTYYGVEDFLCRPNVEMSFCDREFAPAETLRTGAVSLLRDLESIPERSNVRRVIVASGDQHCFAITKPIRKNVRDDAHGIPYITLGGAGAPIQRSTVFPAPGKIPGGLLKHAFDDKHFWTEFRVFPDEVRFTVREAYSDSLLYTQSWGLEGGPLESPTPDAAACLASLECFPNPARGDGLQFLFCPPASLADASLEDLSVYDVQGRRVRSLFRGGWQDGTYLRSWDLRDEDGRRVAAGRYYVRARAGAEAYSEPFTVLR
jgi:hypothetical protein